MNASKKTINNLVGYRLVLRIYAYLLLSQTLCFKAHNSIDLGEERIVLANTDVVTGMKMRSALPDKNVARQNELPVRTLGSKTLRLAVATVSGAANTFFMSKKLQIHHRITPSFP